ncbi:MAG TPA: dTDP-glucose 4,6-dehydratase [Candidatus Polarisedimenticolaceae bacterium]|nr:dTDP-glucose 4,6-dehydratase [Candidatus Polarisedimenticolaceae bacterium]
MAGLLVTGGAGFIGSNFVRKALAETDHTLIVLDKLTYAGSLHNLDGVADEPRLRFVRGDIADRELTGELLGRGGVTAIVNFAAESHVDRSIDSPRPFVDTNIVGTFELLVAARDHLARLDEPARKAFRFLHVSTDEVFGSLGADGRFSETTRYAPNSPYAASKASADHLVRAFHHTYGLPTLLTNCSNNYGPYQFPEKLIPLVILNAADGEELPIYGDGMNVRDWLYVEDHCDGVLRVLDAGRPGESYNIGGDCERPNVAVVDAILDALERRLPAATNERLAARGVGAYRELKRFVPDRPGHDRRYAIDASRIRAELGWSPEHDFDSGIDATVSWYLGHRDWCDAVQREAGYGRERLGLKGDDA